MDWRSLRHIYIDRDMILSCCYDYSQLSDRVVVLVTTLYTVSNVLDWGTKVRLGIICSRVSSVIPGTWVRHVLGDH